MQPDPFLTWNKHFKAFGERAENPFTPMTKAEKRLWLWRKEKGRKKNLYLWGRIKKSSYAETNRGLLPVEEGWDHWAVRTSSSPPLQRQGHRVYLEVGRGEQRTPFSPPPNQASTHLETNNSALVLEQGKNMERGPLWGRDAQGKLKAEDGARLVRKTLQ